MSRTNGILAALLVGQLILAGVTWSTLRSTPDEATKQTIVEVDVDALASVRIEATATAGDQEPEALELEKRGDDWVVSSAFDYPANADKVETLASNLAKLKAGDPIATTKASHNALRVGDKDFDRKLVVNSGDGEQSFILGNGSRGAVHVRREGEDEVFAARGISVWDIRADLRSYIRSRLVNAETSRVAEVTVKNEHGTITMAKQDDGTWALAELPPGTPVDQNVARSFVNAVSRFHLEKPVAREATAAHGLDGGVEVSVVEMPESKPDQPEQEEAPGGAKPDDAAEPVVYRYKIGGPADDKFYFVKTADGEYVVTVAKSAVSQALEKKAEDFAKKAKESEES